MSGGVWALLGSAEFLPWAEEVDLWSLDRARPGPVLLLPTASAPEGEEVFDRWGRMGLEHYARLGVDAEVVQLKTREDAERADLASRLDAAGAVFFSGGTPGSLAATLAGTRFWATLMANLDVGLGYGGCSAGIAALGRASRVAPPPEHVLARAGCVPRNEPGSPLGSRGCSRPRPP